MRSFFVFDVESVGLYGEGFAVGGGVFLENGVIQWGFTFSCEVMAAQGSQKDRDWVLDNVPIIELTHRTPKLMRSAFWNVWLKAKREGATMAADCLWPVEAAFLRDCIHDDFIDRHGDGPYPFIEIGSVLLAAGMDPIGTYDREPSELPKHNPYCDAMQSARLLAKALDIINGNHKPAREK